MADPIQSLQPPNAPPGDRAIEAAAAAQIPLGLDLRTVWDPATCPAELLPWLAWGLSIDIWDADWSEASKRMHIAQAISRQRRKGSVAAVREVLDEFEVDLTIHEWFDEGLPPFTFEVRLPVEDSLTGAAALIEKVADHVTRVKPARAHFTVAQTLEAGADLGMVAVARAASAVRLDMAEAAPVSWAGVLLTEDGEPLFTEGDERLETE
ncbi:phage tail protein I [Brevundimonas nasdae]|uniref:phage tail protein I n=1 Tax=Brevundimonas nasdae TaxID=172043 RepID=UPI003F690839